MEVIIGTDFNYEWDGIILRDVMFEPESMPPMLNELFEIQQGVKSKLQMHFSPKLMEIIEADQGCGSQETGDGVELYNKTLQTEDLRVEFPQCADVFKNKFTEEDLKSGNDVNDLSGTAIQNRIITPLLRDAVMKDLFNILCFGDVNSGDPKRDMFDGLWTVILSDEYCGTNASTGFSATLQPGEALAAFKSCYNNAPSEFDDLDENDRAFYVTRSIYNNLQDSYESNSSGSDLQMQYLENGIPQLTYRGIRVVKISVWDNYIKKKGLSNPHRILYTTRENHVAGFDVQADAISLKMWYENKDDQMYYRMKFPAGYQFKFCSYNTYAI